MECSRESAEVLYYLKKTFNAKPKDAKLFLCFLLREKAYSAYMGRVYKNRRMTWGSTPLEEIEYNNNYQYCHSTPEHILINGFLWCSYSLEKYPDIELYCNHYNDMLPDSDDDRYRHLDSKWEAIDLRWKQYFRDNK